MRKKMNARTYFTVHCKHQRYNLSGTQCTFYIEFNMNVQFNFSLRRNFAKGNNTTKLSLLNLCITYRLTSVLLSCRNAPADVFPRTCYVTRLKHLNWNRPTIDGFEIEIVYNAPCSILQHALNAKSFL